VEKGGGGGKRQKREKGQLTAEQLALPTPGAGATGRLIQRKEKKTKEREKGKVPFHKPSPCQPGYDGGGEKKTWKRGGGGRTSS